MKHEDKAGIILKQMISNKGIKQAWVAEKLGISNSRLSQMLKRDPGIEMTLRILKLIESDFKVFDQLYKKEDSAIPPRTTESSNNEI